MIRVSWIDIFYTGNPAYNSLALTFNGAAIVAFHQEK